MIFVVQTARPTFTTQNSRHDVHVTTFTSRCLRHDVHVTTFTARWFATGRSRHDDYNTTFTTRRHVNDTTITTRRSSHGLQATTFTHEVFQAKVVEFSLIKNQLVLTFLTFVVFFVCVFDNDALFKPLRRLSLLT